MTTRPWAVLPRGRKFASDCSTPPKPPWIDLLVYLPNAARQPSPVFLGLNYGNQGVADGPRNTPFRNSIAARGQHSQRWPPALLLKRGHAVATFHGGDIELDRHGSGCNFSYEV